MSCFSRLQSDNPINNTKHRVNSRINCFGIGRENFGEFVMGTTQILDFTAQSKSKCIFLTNMAPFKGKQTGFLEYKIYHQQELLQHKK